MKAMNILQKSSILKFLNKSSLKGRALIFPVLVLVLVICFFASLFCGSTTVDVFTAFKDMLKGETESADFKILFYLRLPRALGAVFAGAGLALSGAIIQAVLGNPMASPGTIGVNAGAGFAAIIFIAIFPAALPFLPIAAFLGALVATLLIYFIAAKTDCEKLSLILVGIAVGSILTAAISLIKNFFPDAVYDATVFSVGTLSGLDISSLFPAGYIIIAGFITAFVLHRGLDILNLGEVTAKSLGIRVKSMQFLLLITASILAGSAVSFSGLLGFIGLIVPHIGRRVIGGEHKKLIPFCALFGPIILLVSDLISRIIFAPYEIPVGILLSFIGCPFFIFLIITKKGYNK